MEVIPSNLCTLVEQLEDARQFHAGAARQSDGFRRECHRERSRAYATMLSEIRAWESRKRRFSATHGSGASCDDPGVMYPDDTYAALLDRVYRIHSSAAPAGQTTHARTTGVTTDGLARDGRRCAGERMHC